MVPLTCTNFLRPDHFNIGLFGANCASGLAATTVPARWTASWDNNRALALMADAAGLEFMLPIARWRGYDGPSGFHDASFETVAWACGLLAATEKLRVFSTVHVPLIHPIFAAKQIATVDHVGRGRLGVNIVCGWNEDEFDMFAIAQRGHDERYDYAGEWLDVVAGLWTADKPFDYAGRYLTFNNVTGDPKLSTAARPIMMNAAASPSGIAFAIKRSDVLFTILPDLETGRRHVAAIQAQALAARGRAIDVFTNTYVVCRPTQAEAEDYHHHYAVEHADWAVVDRLWHMQNAQTQGRSAAATEMWRKRIAGGHGGFPLIGTPDYIAQRIGALAQAGFTGCTIAFVDYLKELPYFVSDVLPRLEKAGIRRPRTMTQAVSS